jgi:hypothetical protein
MDTITFRCTSCKFALKVGADKAGRNAKCSKCGTILTIPARSEAAPAQPPPPPEKKSDDDDGPMTYVLKEDVDPGAERQALEELSKPRVIKKPGRAKTKKEAKITNPDEWRRVGLGCRIIAVGLGMWLAAYVLYHLPLVLGMAQGEEFAAAADKQLAPNEAKPGELELAPFAVAALSGEAWAGTMLLVVRLALVLFILVYGPLLVGYVICLAVPNRFGTRLQLFVLLGLALVNALLLIIFKFLPLFGVIRFAIIPLIMPEVSMLEMNVERTESLESFWLRVPVIEAYLAILVTLLAYLELALIATFARTVGKSIKSEELEARGLTAMSLAFSQVFIQTAWLMASWCGTSQVLVWALRFTYTVGAGFLVYQLLVMIAALSSVPSAVEEQLGEEQEDSA